MSGFPTCAGCGIVVYGELDHLAHLHIDNCSGLPKWLEDGEDGPDFESISMPSFTYPHMDKCDWHEYEDPDRPVRYLKGSFGEEDLAICEEHDRQRYNQMV